MKTTRRPVRRPRITAERFVLILLGVLAGARCSVETTDFRFDLGGHHPAIHTSRTTGAR